MHLSPRGFHWKRVTLALVISILILCFYLSDLSILGLNLFDEPVTVVSEDPPGAWSNHPIVQLHERAQKEFDAVLQRQSKTPDEAVTEYTRRYGRTPPPGFRQWVEYALAHGSPIIDDFDAISHGVHRFSNLTTADVTRRMREATENKIGEVHNDGIEKCVFVEGKFSQGCRNFADPLTKLLGDAWKIAPDVEFLINFLDEPSVLLGQHGEGDGSVSPWRDLSHRSITTTVAEACRLRGNSTSDAIVGDPIQTYGLPFVQDVGAARDLCQHPEYGSGHGFLMCPATFRHMRTEIPMLSQAAPYPFSDILYPSTHYGLKSSLYKQSEDRAWDRKKNAVYWTGSSTGGHWSQNTWRHGHRQRLATLALHKDERNFTYLRRSSDAGVGVQPYTTNAFHNSLFDIALTKIVGCDDEVVCDEQRRFFNIPRPIDSESRPFRYRFVLDIDGNSYSGRFYRFLASHSVPLKVSIFREWHDERLVPWLHYIAVSQSMNELPELMRFLATTSKGQKISHRIAEAGREWYFKAMTPIHQGIYLYRLMLELAWLQDESRPIG
jgi:hypothetical protein